MKVWVVRTDECVYLKYWKNVILWPSFSETPAHTMFDDAPYKLPLPPKVGPNANAKAIGWTGRLSVLLSASETTIFTIIAVTGIESTTDDVKADTFTQKKD